MQTYPDVPDAYEAETERYDPAHVLFIDIVGYGLAPMNRQAALIEELQELVRRTTPFREASPGNELILLPRGDGMALVFFDDFLSPVNCALELAAKLKERPHLRVRMGVHSGPVIVISNILDEPDVSGDGIVMAQRVMDCGDAGHILLSESVATRLEKMDGWIPMLHDHGFCGVKHGGRVHIYNLCGKGLGNPQPPRKLLQEAAIVIDRARVYGKRRSPLWVLELRSPALITLWSAGVLGFFFLTFWYVSPAFRGIIREAYGLNRTVQTTSPSSVR